MREGLRACELRYHCGVYPVSEQSYWMNNVTGVRIGPNRRLLVVEGWSLRLEIVWCVVYTDGGLLVVLIHLVLRRLTVEWGEHHPD